MKENPINRVLLFVALGFCFTLGFAEVAAKIDLTKTIISARQKIDVATQKNMKTAIDKIDQLTKLADSVLGVVVPNAIGPSGLLTVPLKLIDIFLPAYKKAIADLVGAATTLASTYGRSKDFIQENDEPVNLQHSINDLINLVVSNIRSFATSANNQLAQLLIKKIDGGQAVLNGTELLQIVKNISQNWTVLSQTPSKLFK